MTILNSVDWLEQSWLTQQWLSGQPEDSINSQVDLKILDIQQNIFNQAELKIDKEININSQVEKQIDSDSNIFSQVENKINFESSILSEVKKIIENFNNENNSEVELKLTKLESIKSQVERVLIKDLGLFGQVEKAIDELSINRAEVFKSNLYYVICQGWLDDNWLTQPWLTRKPCAGSRQQVYLKVQSRHNVGSQVERKILDFESNIKNEVTLTIDVEYPVFSQVQKTFVQHMKSQVLIALYNITRPRILYEFPSRGLTGLNWTASTTQPGDFSILNVNNDISEMYWRSATGQMAAVLSCDTEITQGIFLDTFYMEGHNLTSSAVIVLEGSNDAGFSPVEITRNLTTKGDKIYFVEPVLPTKSYRYWRLNISDVTNTQNYLKVGLIVFGSSIIFNSECSTQDIIVSAQEFKNAVKTEGFTSVGNSRSLKRSIKLDFVNLSYDSGDYTRLNSLINDARTTLKCLWIPDPRNQSLMARFAVFGKLTKIPEQRHNVKGHNDNMDFIDLSLEIDEAE